MRALFVFLIWLYPILSLAQSETFRFPEGRVQLSGGINSLLVSFDLIPDWHIYWQNPGDSGAAPKFAWQSPEVEIRQEGWPVPQRFLIAGLVNIGYSGKVEFPFSAPGSADKSLDVSLKLEFLVCKIECIPYFADLQTRLESRPGKSPTFASDLVSGQNIFGAKLLNLSQTSNDVEARLVLPENLKTLSKNLHVFPFDGLTFKPNSPEVGIDGDPYRIRIPVQENAKDLNKEFQFLVALQDAQGKTTAFQIFMETEKPNLFWILLGALLGGVILNIMPCVFPVLSIKILSFLGPDKDKKSLVTGGWLYTLGIVVSFLVIGSTLLILRAQGEEIGWGFQLQSPLVASAIGILFFWLSLNFLGFFEIGQSLSQLDSYGNTRSKWGAFLTGVLATVVATPCTAPFMGTALGASLTLPAHLTLLIFLTLGLGMALPFLLFSYVPGLLKFLPKPGAWMQTLKEFLAFPLLLTVAWLFWVVSQQTQTESVLGLLLLLIFIGFAVWFSGKIKNEKFRQYALLFFFLVSLSAPALFPAQAPGPKAATKADWPVFSDEAVQSSLKQGRPVFIDFTAAWCITCQVNKKLVLNTPAVKAFFLSNKVDHYRADWTDHDPKITKALSRFGRNSLPLYVFYKSADHRPQLLPEVLTQQIILDLLPKN